MPNRATRPPRRTTAPPPPAAVPVRGRSEWIWTGGVAAAAAALFATTLSSTVSLGDAPESVAGIASLGILHAPGYPVYVVLARLFTIAFPVGSLTLRTNVFSLLCATASVAGVFRLARLLGASRPGAAIGALTLALGTSFWFYADFAKHDALSALLVVTATVCVVEWDQRRDRRLLVASGALVGLTLGASWPLGVLIAAPLLLFALLARGRREVVASIVAAVVLAAAVVVFVVVRAGQSPAVNWGDATTSHRVVDLLSMRDFSFAARHVPGLAPHTAEATPQQGAAGFAGKLANYPLLLAREAGVVALLLAAWGAVVAWRRLARSRAVLLAATFALGVLGTAEIVGPGQVRGFETVLVVGGFFATIFMSVAVLAALGGTDLIERASSRVLAGVVTAVIAIAALVPSAVVHHHVATHRVPPFADDYAANVFRSLPPGAAILTRGGEFTFSLVYEQLVRGRRRDVLVVAADTLAGSRWYRGELARKAGVTLPDLPSQGAELVAVAHLLQSRRPVYMDMLTTDALRPAIGYVARGLVSAVVDGVGPKLPPSVDDVEQLIDHDYVTHSVYDHRVGREWPNPFLLTAYVRAHLELARDYNELGRLDKVASEAHRALDVDPSDSTALGIMKALAARSGSAP